MPPSAPRAAPTSPNAMLKIGERIRQARLERGLSQGDLESRTGLLRCYLSRVENGHTEPSLQTLVRLATALDMPLVGFFQEVHDDQAGPPPATNHGTGGPMPRLSDEQMAFLVQMRQYAGTLTEGNRQKVLLLARQMAGQD